MSLRIWFRSHGMASVLAVGIGKLPDGVEARRETNMCWTCGEGIGQQRDGLRRRHTVLGGAEEHRAGDLNRGVEAGGVERYADMSAWSARRRVASGAR